MQQLSITQKKWLKSIHLLAAGIWVTTGLTMFLLHFMRNELQTGDQLHLINKIIHFIDMKILVPSAIVSLLTGWIYSQFTKWGYFQHGWLIFKWIITLLIIILGTLYSGPWIAEMVRISGELGLTALSNTEYQWYDKSQTLMGICMNGTLILTIFISVFKPGKSKKKINK
ncbi:hypothetical protein BZG01_13195 [Labilibaculum manganireducens]|uniref:DUF2269 domain-containing protein n=1 Tax=Labilibaculum manganireducens TaxID=1940525 RepID=A0A2N3I525_9BACT|nr:hypothetical protein [Labilibaculum manganireducens]PKQ65405.1 hypothetical protein BZG01_13195 [Labilibaculum manganireducens]